MDGEAVLSALCGGVKPSLSLVAASLSALGLIPFEAITLSPGQAHHRIAPVTSTTTTTTTTPATQDSNQDCKMLKGRGDSR